MGKPLAQGQLRAEKPTCYDEAMIRVLEDAIEKVTKLPTEWQAHAAEILEHLVANADTEEFEIPEEHMEAVLEGLPQARSGELASDDEIAGLWKKWGL
jgi:hypothetical protein